MERGTTGGAAHAVVAAHSVQSVAHHPRTDRVGSESRSVDGGTVGGSPAAFTQCRRARFFAAGRRDAVCEAVSGATAAAVRRPPPRRVAEPRGNPGRMGAEPD